MFQRNERKADPTIRAKSHATLSVHIRERFTQAIKQLVESILKETLVNGILASPFLGYLVVMEQYVGALILFVAAGLTDLLDGLIARQFPSQMSYFGSVLDPIADKILVGVLTVSLCITSLLPVSLAVIILGRDIALIIASFAVRLISLPQPRNVSRFFDFQLPTVQVTPSTFGKVNTVLQLGLISLSLAAPVFNFTENSCLTALQYTVAITTILSGLDYFITRRGFHILKKNN